MPYNPELKGPESVTSFQHLRIPGLTGPQGIQIRINQAKELPTCLTHDQESRLRVELSTREGRGEVFQLSPRIRTGQSDAMIGRRVKKPQ